MFLVPENEKRNKVFFLKEHRKNSLKNIVFPWESVFYGYSRNTTGPSYYPNSTVCNGHLNSLFVGENRKVDGAHNVILPHLCRIPKIYVDISRWTSGFIAIVVKVGLWFWSCVDFKFFVPAYLFKFKGSPNINDLIILSGQSSKVVPWNLPNYIHMSNSI